MRVKDFIVMADKLKDANEDAMVVRYDHETGRFIPLPAGETYVAVGVSVVTPEGVVFTDALVLP